MGTTALGDIPSGALLGVQITHASVASDGAGTLLAAIGVGVWRAPQNIRIIDAWWEPTGADNATAQAASYRRVDLDNGGADGTGTTVLASINLTASLASNTTRALTLATTPTVSKGSIVCASIGATVGGAHASGTLVRAGQFHFTYRPI